MDAREALRRAIAAEHHLYLEAQKHERRAERWRQRADLALRRTEQDLARLALERSAAEERLAASYRAEYASQTEVIRRAKHRERLAVAVISEPPVDERLV